MKEMNFGDKYYNSLAKMTSVVHAFWIQVVNKTQQFEINRTDAIFEVYTDRIIEKTQDCDKALLWITSQEISEFPVSYFNGLHGT